MVDDQVRAYVLTNASAALNLSGREKGSIYNAVPSGIEGDEGRAGLGHAGPPSMEP